MSFTHTRTDSLLLMEVTGQLVVGNRQEFKQVVLDEVELGARLVLVDFTNAAYIDSSGLGALVSLGKRVRDVGGDLRLVGLSDDMRSLFELTRLDALFPLYASKDDALKGPLKP